MSYIIIKHKKTGPFGSVSILADAEDFGWDDIEFENSSFTSLQSAVVLMTMGLKDIPSFATHFRLLYRQ